MKELVCEGCPIVASSFMTRVRCIGLLLGYSELMASVFFFLLLLSSGCSLIDQRTFNRNAGHKPRIGHSSVSPPLFSSEAALMNVQYGTPASVWAPPLTQLVQAALKRKQNTLFTLVAKAPSDGDFVYSSQELKEMITTDVHKMANAIVSVGTSPMQVEITGQLQPNTTERVVQLFVR